MKINALMVGGALLALAASAGAEDLVAKFDSRMAAKYAVVTNGMKWIDGRHLPIEGRAFDDVEKFYDRLPAKARVSGGVSHMKHFSAGLQVRFKTDSKRIVVKWLPYDKSIANGFMSALARSGVDVYRMDRPGEWRHCASGAPADYEKGGSLSVEWTPGEPCLINLPNYNGVRELQVGFEPNATVEQAPAHKGSEKPVVFYGTSITQGGTASRPGLSFVNIVGRDLDVPVVNLGFSGCGCMEMEMTEHLARIDAACYVIDCLWNVWGKMVQERYEPFLRKLHELKPETPILVAERCDMRYRPDGTADVTFKDDHAYVRALVERLQKEGMKNLRYLPSAPMNTGDGDSTVDTCHLNDYGMKQAAKAFGAAVREILSESRVSAAAEPFKDGDTVVFFGDSITHGGRYHEFVTDFYRTRFPEARIRFVNSGVGGDSANGAMPRIPVDVEAYKPTWVTFHFGMNDIDRGAYTATPTVRQLVRADAAQKGYRGNLDELVAAVRKAAPGAKHVYFTPTVYDDTAVPTNIPPDATGWAVVNQIGCNAGLGLMAGHVLATAERDGALGVDWYTPLENWLMARRPKDPHYMLTGWDRVHPGALGHAIMAWCFLKRQGVPAVVSDVALDAAAGTVTRSGNAAVSEVAKTADGVRCTVLAKALPFPVPPEAREALGEFAVEETLNREVFAVSGLKPGEYALLIDGAEVARADAAALAKGLRLGFNEKTPQYRQAQAFFTRNAELAAREREMRNAHAARWLYAMRKAPVDDVKAFAEWFEKNEKDKNGYFAKCVPGYLEYWPHYRESRERLWADQEKARETVRPVAHRYEVKRVAADR